MLFHTPELSLEETAVLNRIEERRQTIGRTLLSPRRWHGQLRRVAFAKATKGSNEIEGFHVTVDDAIAAVEGEEPLEAGSETWQAILGYQNAMTYVLQLADDPHFSFSEALLRGLHFMMLSYDLSKHPGRWKSRDNTVTSEATGELVYTPPPWNDVPELMAELVRSLERDNTETPGMVKAAMAHLNLTMIHPFLDGNGRMARCLQSLVLARTGILAPPFCSIEEYLGRNTHSYYAVLAEVGQGSWNPGRSARPWVRFCLTAHYRQAETLIRRLKKMERVWTMLEEQVKRRKLPERMTYALFDAALGLKVRNALYREAADVSPQLASRDLGILVEYGFLTPKGEKRGRYYFASPEIRALGIEQPESKRIGDPFETLNREPVLPGLEEYTL